MAFLLQDYKDVQEIARGGMGKVYLATQISLNRKVVIKEMASGLLTDFTEVRRFENEARAAAALDHDNIIRIYDFGEDRGSFYISMEYIDGPDLEEIVKNNENAPEIALMILLQALKGLEFAHHRHIIHRDIKPGNILISKTGAVKVVDFGLAHAGKQQLHLTATDIIVGTPLFMSPEQATGEERKDIRMDIWAVGVLLYRIITGKYPFTGENVPAILFNIVQTKEPPIETLVPTLPDDLIKKINQCLEKDRSKRLRSLTPLIESLQNYFYEIGIKDPVEQIKKYLLDPLACGKELSKLLHDFHERESEARASEGDDQKAEAHFREAKKRTAMYRPFIRALSAIKTVYFSPGGSKPQRRTGRFFDSVAPFKRYMTVSGLMLMAVAIGFFLFFQLQREEKSDRKTSVAAIPAAQAMPPKETATKLFPDPLVRPPAGISVKTDSTFVLSAPAPGANRVPERKETPVRKANRSRETSKALPPATGVIKVTVQPPSAEVTLDGKKLTSREMSEGKRLKAGIHTLIAQAEGHKPYEKTMPVEKNAEQVVAIDLLPLVKGMASIHIHSYPWAEIYIDGLFQGNSPTPKPILLSEGTHTIVLKRNGYKTHEEAIAFTSGELRRIKVQLIPK